MHFSRFYIFVPFLYLNFLRNIFITYSLFIMLVIISLLMNYQAIRWIINQFFILKIFKTLHAIFYKQQKLGKNLSNTQAEIFIATNKMFGHNNNNFLSTKFRPTSCFIYFFFHKISSIIIKSHWFLLLCQKKLISKPLFISNT